jgi:hypothetical protein
MVGSNPTAERHLWVIATARRFGSVAGEVAGLDLPTASLAALSARTEGWVAGLQLAALSLQRDVDPAGFVASFSGSHRFVLDYLTEEVLARQPEELVRFLRRPRSWTGSRGRCATPSPARPAVRRPWSRSSGPTCSWSPWTRPAAGGGTTACSPSCCATDWSGHSPTAWPRSTGTRPPGWRTTGWSTRQCTTP